jgi:alkylation response protein AidB-like acyl-CoA dehydrogenase
VQELIKQDLCRFGDVVVTPKVRNWVADAERNPPCVKHFDTFGKRIDELVTSTGWQELQKVGISEGIVALGHDSNYGHHNRTYQFIKYHIWTPWNACVTCPSAMTDGGAQLLKLQLAKDDLDHERRLAFEDYYTRLTSRDPEKAWTSGQWMTERPGGSDVRATETQASTSGSLSPAGSEPVQVDVTGKPLGPISVTGFKWFSSATDANATVLLAKEPDGSLSSFFAPMRRTSSSPETTDTELNGIQIQRLKSKLGTRALPTAELVLTDMRAWRVGKPGQGVKEISTILNITRLHNAVTAIGLLGRGLAISRAFAKVRKARDLLLMDTPVHVHTLAELHVEYRAAMYLTYYTAALMGACEGQQGVSTHKSPCEQSQLVPLEVAPLILRLLTPLAKMTTAKVAIAGLAECMESLGGLGYLETEDPALNIARLFRDANVLSIWEGTTNIMADDVIRIVKGSAGPATLATLDGMVSTATKRWRYISNETSSGPKKLYHTWAEQLEAVWADVRSIIDQTSKEELLLKGRLLAKDLTWVICSVLLAEDALSDGDAASIEICDRWISQRGGHRPVGLNAAPRSVALDRLVVFGVEAGVTARL